MVVLSFTTSHAEKKRYNILINITILLTDDLILREGLVGDPGPREDLLGVDDLEEGRDEVGRAHRHQRLVLELHVRAPRDVALQIELLVGTVPARSFFLLLRTSILQKSRKHSLQFLCENNGSMKWDDHDVFAVFNN